MNMAKQIYYHNLKEMSMKDGVWYQTANEQERKEFREWLASRLRNGTVEVSFTKVSGEQRDMMCTLDSAQIPEDHLRKSQIKESVEEKEPTNQPVFDLNAQGWRSFRYDKITKITLKN